jgi:hypothetical protein
MPSKVKTATGYKNIIDRKVANGDGTFTDINRTIEWHKDGNHKTLWQRDKEFFKLTIDTRQTNTGYGGTSNEFILPTSNSYAYNWSLNWGDNSPVEHVIGTGAPSSNGILHVYPEPGQYQITIRPAGGRNAWIRAFGLYSLNSNDATQPENRNKIVSPDSPLTVAMYANAGATNLSNVHSIGFNLFSLCTGVGFRLGNKFGFSEEWNRVTSVGNGFGQGMFHLCSTLPALPDGFNLPQNLTSVGTTFCLNMFEGCSALSALPDGFNLPQNLLSVGILFCRCMFVHCTSNNFQVNAAFRFPKLSQAEIDKENVFYQTFYCWSDKTYPRQTKTDITTILNGNPAPSTARQTFIAYNDIQGANRWADWNNVHENWRT